MPEEIIAYRCRQCGEHWPKEEMVMVQKVRLTLGLQSWQVEKHIVPAMFDMDDSAFCNINCFCDFVANNAKPS